MKICRDCNSGLEVGLPAFQLPMFAKCDALKEICSTSLFKESIPICSFGNSKHPLPTRSLRLLREAVCSTSSALCLHYACKSSHPIPLAIPTLKWGSRDPKSYQFCTDQSCSKMGGHISQEFELTKKTDQQERSVS